MAVEVTVGRLQSGQTREIARVRGTVYTVTATSPMTKFHCPNCAQKIEAGPEFFGATISCPACNEMLIVPGEAPPTQAPATVVPRVISRGTPPPSKEQLERNEARRGCLFLLGTLGAFLIGLAFLLWMAADPKQRGLPEWFPLAVGGTIFVSCMALMPRRVAGPWKRHLAAQIVAGAISASLALGISIGLMSLAARTFGLGGKVFGAVSVGITLGIIGLTYAPTLRVLVRVFKIPNRTLIR